MIPKPLPSALPLRAGVPPSRVALPPGPWGRMLDFLAERFAHIPRDEWQRRMAAGEVLDAQGRPVSPDAAFAAHGWLFYYRSPPPELPIPFEAPILYQDAHVLVADKPHFLPVVPSGRYLQETLLMRLRRQTGLTELVPVHRIDRDTAGLVLFSVNPATRARYVGLFRERLVTKVYEAVAPWREGLPEQWVHRSRLAVTDHFMCVHEVPGPPNTETHITRLQRLGAWAQYRLSPLTGYRHQLRVHMNACGLPLRHDMIYPVLQPACPQGVPPDYARPLQLLARSLAFQDPVSAEPRCFSSQRRLQGPPEAEWP